MKTTIILVRISDRKETERTFNSKKECQRFLSNNYTTYTWRNK